MKQNLLVSFSGGRTSGYMLKWIYDNWQDRYNLITVFANTGKEHEGTLEFVRDCEKNWGIPIYWVEARHRDDDGIPFSEKGWAVRHRVVDFESASRNGEPFEEMISVLGIPSSSVPFCSDQLKRKPIEHFLKTIEFKGYYKAIGIRCDEIDRIDEKWREKKIVYPFVNEHPVVEFMVMSWWAQQGFDLDIPPDLGNCDACWKKDRKRLLRIADKHPSVLNWWQRVTDKYGHLRPRKTDLEPPFNFYRGNHSPKDLFSQLKLSKQQLDLFVEAEKLDGCSESCEAF